MLLRPIVVEKRFNTVGRVVVAGGVEDERKCSIGRVIVAGGIAEERANTDGRVDGASGVVNERVSADGRVAAAGVAGVRVSTNGRVVAGGSVARERLEPMAVFLEPVVLLLSASLPVAVLSPPSVLEKSAQRQPPCCRSQGRFR